MIFWGGWRGEGVLVDVKAEKGKRGTLIESNIILLEIFWEMNVLVFMPFSGEKRSDFYSL